MVKGKKQSEMWYTKTIIFTNTAIYDNRFMLFEIKFKWLYKQNYILIYDYFNL